MAIAIIVAIVLMILLPVALYIIGEVVRRERGNGTWRATFAELAAELAADVARIFAAASTRVERFAMVANEASEQRARTQIVDMRDVLDCGATVVNVRVAQIIAATDADALVKARTARLYAVAA